MGVNMKRKQKDCYEDGITLETNLIAAKYLNPRMIQIIQLLFMIMSLYGTIFSMLSGLEIKVDTGTIYMFIFVSIGVSLLTSFAVKYGLIIHISLFGLYLYAGYSLWDRFKNGFWHLENIYIKHINDYYNSSISLYIVDKYEPIHVLTLFFIFFVIFLSFIICQAILGRLPIFIMFLTTLTLIVLPIAVGKIPDTLPFVAYIVSLFGILGLNSGLNLGKKHFFKVKIPRGKEYLRNKVLQYGIGLKTGLLLSMSMILLFAILPFIFTAKFYTDQVKVPVLKENMQKRVMEYDASAFTDFFSQGYFSNISLFPSAQSTGGLSKGELGRVASVKYTNRTALRVTVTGEREGIYLKGFAGSVYDGNSWEDFDKEALDTYKELTSIYSDRLVPSNLGSKLMDILYANKDSMGKLDDIFQMDSIYQNIKIKNIDAGSKAVYIPYFSSIPNSTEYDNSNESYVKTNNKIKESQFSFYNMDNNVISVDWEQAFADSLSYWQREAFGDSKLEAVFNDLYEYFHYEYMNREFAYNYYLQIPEKGMERLKSELGDFSYELYKRKFDEQALLKVISYVRELVQKDTVYSLSPGVLPKGKDFVDYFLFENRKGYCTHYASSGAIIFRMLGIPARYVEGFVIKDTDFSRGKKIGSASVQYRKGSEYGIKNKDIYDLKIKDANAHAWVEIYKDGFGWVPVEMTPGYSQLDDTLTEGVAAEKDINIPTIAPTQMPTMGAEREEDEIGKRVNNTSDQEDSMEKINNLLDKMVVVMIGILCICIIPVLASVVIRRRRIKIAALKNASGKAIFYYVHLKRIMKHFRIETENRDYMEINQQITEEFEDITEVELVSYLELINKAKFSNKLISQSELKRTQDFYNRVLRYLYLNKPWYKKLYYKYIQIF